MHGVLFLLQISVDYSKFKKDFILTPRRTMAKALGRCKHHSFAKHAVHNVMTRSYIVKHLGRVIKGELHNQCSNSVLLKTGKCYLHLVG